VVDVSVTTNHDPRAIGCDLLDPSLPPDTAVGFPVCRATVRLEAEGYAAALGWLQLVRSTDAGDDFELDPLALFREVATPFAFFGIKPELFDAPFRATRDDLTWTAHTFLCVVPDGVMSRVVVPLVAFSWGFTVTDQVVILIEPAVLSLRAWSDHVLLLSSTYPSWTFALP
jgi:hypothetical protein